MRACKTHVVAIATGHERAVLVGGHTVVVVVPVVVVVVGCIMMDHH